MTPTLSIITVNFNNIDGLKKTLNSVMSQTETDFEYIIIDGASNDGSAELIKEYAEHPEYGKKITHWVSEPDSGIYNAMNKGIKTANGYYCLFLNSGDYLISDSVVSSINKLNTKPCIYYADAQYAIDNKFTILLDYEDSIDANYFLIGNTVNHQNTLIPLEILKKYNYDEQYSIKADWFFFLFIAYKEICKFKHLDFKIAVYDFSGMSSSGAYEHQIDEEIKKGIKTIFGKLSTSILDYKELKDSIYSRTIKISGNTKFYQFYLKVYLYIARRIGKFSQNFDPKYKEKTDAR